MLKYQCMQAPCGRCTVVPMSPVDAHYLETSHEKIDIHDIVLWHRGRAHQGGGVISMRTGQGCN